LFPNKVVEREGDMAKKTKKESVLDNLDIRKDFVVVSVNPKVYSLEVVKSAGYVLMDRAYVLIDGDPRDELFVELRPKASKEDLTKLGEELNNELLNYSVFLMESERNKGIRDAMVKKALESHGRGGSS
jgi:His-Xaa-Ser system protein HxsD